MSESHKERVNMNVTSLSKKLLEGWTLLSESCSNASCNVPLVRNKAQTEVFCVSCEQYFMTNTAVGSPVAKAQPGSVPSTVAPTSPRPPEPLASQHVLPTPPSDFSPTSPEKRARPSEGDSPSTKVRADKQSALLAEKLLHGWTLLNEYCPMERCLTPLVRNREKKMFCVNCDLWVVPEAMVAADKYTLQEPSRQTGAVDTKGLVLEARDIGASERSSNEVQTQELGGSSLPPPATTTATAAAPQPTAPGVSSGPGLATSAQRAIDALVVTLDEYSQMLSSRSAAAGNGGDLQQRRDLCCAIQEAAQAIATLQSLNKS